MRSLRWILALALPSMGGCARKPPPAAAADAGSGVSRAVAADDDPGARPPTAASSSGATILNGWDAASALAELGRAVTACEPGEEGPDLRTPQGRAEAAPEIYARVLKKMTGAKVPVIVREAVTVSPFHGPPVPDHGCVPAKSAVDDFFRQGAAAGNVLPPRSAALISAAEERKMFATPPFLGGGWQALNDRYGAWSALVSFTAIGFSRDANEAVVYGQYSAGWLAGAGGMYLLKRTADGWRVESQYRIWVS